MKRIIFITIISIILLGCNDPKSTPVPKDVSKIGEDPKFSEQAKKLDDADKQMLAGYLMRAGLSQVLGQHSDEQVTIGEAIKNQKQWMKDREIKEKEDEQRRQAELKKLEDQKVALNNAFKITYIKRGDLTKVNYSDHLPIYLNFQNLSNKPISGLKALLVFTDQFGKEFKTLSIEESTTIPAALDKTVPYLWDYNQFDDGMVKLHTLEEGKFKVEAYPIHIVFDDGTVLKMD